MMRKKSMNELPMGAPAQPVGLPPAGSEVGKWFSGFGSPFLFCFIISLLSFISGRSSAYALLRLAPI